ncbi:hypothetical protein SESBI_12776 [Sesbania bispinosa]|nr:hypothetical protein SESBI_12776 [Sesbania bispinosa]
MGPFKSKTIIEGPRRNVGSRIATMASAAMRALRAAQVQGGGANWEPEVDMNLSDEEPAPNGRGPGAHASWHKHKSKSPKKKKRRGGSARVVTDEDESVRETRAKERRRMGSRMYEVTMRPSRGEVNGLKASVELVGKELKSYKTSNEQLKTAVAALVKKNLVRHEAKWDEEKAKLVAIGNSLVKDSFENSMAQLSIRNPGLVRDGVSHEFEVFRGHVCKVDTSARKLVDVDSGVELADWDEEGKYRDGEE